MRRRIHLRSRIFAITALHALMLIGIAFLLTWRGRNAQEEFDRIVSVDLRAVTRLEELIRSQSAFEGQWEAAGEKARYHIVTQLLETAPLDTIELPELRRAVAAYQTTLSGTDRRSRQRASAAVIAEARAAIRVRRDAIETTLPSLRRSARDTTSIALGVAYIIAIVSFAVASITLAKVVRPLEALARASERIAAGDGTARAPVAGDHEVAQLGSAFNRMAEEVDRARKQLEERATTDELTGLPNFRAFSEILDQEMKRAGRYGETFAVLVLDLDHFKQYNDRFGHLAGNDALQAVARSIRESLREADVPARYGGEEFVAILPNAAQQEMFSVAERIRQSIENLPPPPGRAPITVSIGGAIFPDDGPTAERLFAAADRRLYEAKSAGRNRVVVGSRRTGGNAAAGA
jgi:diguanylate cyclase (GGDEF)-like protein